MAVGVTNQDLMVRLHPDAADSALAEPGARPMNPQVHERWNVVDHDVRRHEPAAAPLLGPSCGVDFFAPSASLDVDGAGTILLAYSANSVAQANKTLRTRRRTATRSPTATTWTSPSAHPG